MSINFITSLLLSTNRKKDSYDIIVIIVNHLSRIDNYKLIKTIIHATHPIEVINDVKVIYYNLYELSVSKEDSIYISLFWYLLYYFFGSKQKLFTGFYLQTDSQTEM